MRLAGYRSQSPHTWACDRSSTLLSATQFGALAVWASGPLYPRDEQRAPYHARRHHVAPGIVLRHRCLEPRSSLSIRRVRPGNGRPPHPVDWEPGCLEGSEFAIFVSRVAQRYPAEIPELMLHERLGRADERASVSFRTRWNTTGQRSSTSCISQHSCSSRSACRSISRVILMVVAACAPAWPYGSARAGSSFPSSSSVVGSYHWRGATVPPSSSSALQCDALSSTLWHAISKSFSEGCIIPTYPSVAHTSPM